MILPKIRINRENIILISVLVILVAIPLTVILLGVRQELRKRAEGVNGSIVINNGAEVTSSRGVTLTLTAPGTTQSLEWPKQVLAAENPNPSLGATFAPGEIIVKFKEGKSPAELEPEVTAYWERESSFFGRILNRINTLGTHLASQQTPVEELNQINSVGQAVGVYESRSLRPSGFVLTKAAADQSVTNLTTAYQALPQVEFAEPNYILSATIDVNDPYFPEQWALEKIEASAAWDKTTGDPGIKIAVLDTGVDYNHTDLYGNIIKGYDFSTCNQIDPDTGECLAPKNRDNDPADENGHGTHVSGTISALTNNGKGIAGVNWTTKILAIRVLGADGRGYLSDVIDGLDYALDNGAKVINLSLGGEGSCPLSYTNIFNQAKNKGVAVTVSAGNENKDAAGFHPANCANVITIAATGPNDKKASYSNWGSTIEISAPGGNVTQDRNGDGKLNSRDCVVEECVLSTLINDHYGLAEGTSMAAPHVSGVVGLILSLDPTLTVNEATNILTSTADDLGSPGKDPYFGYGRVNAKKAVTQLSLLPHQP